MPFHPVTAALMYRGIYTIPNILAEQHPVEIPEDELEGERAGGALGEAAGAPSHVGCGGGLGCAAPPARRRGEVQSERDAAGGMGRRRRRGGRNAVGAASGWLKLAQSPWGPPGDVRPFSGGCALPETPRRDEWFMWGHQCCPWGAASGWLEPFQGGGRWGDPHLSPPACSSQQIRQTCVRKSLICAFAIAFIISVMLIAANQVLRSGMK
ncbi:CABP7 protein, partial [Caloenas nicobarica]|nr:CABP7 protein [Caloenas nicobarica]